MPIFRYSAIRTRQTPESEWLISLSAPAVEIDSWAGVLPPAEFDWLGNLARSLGFKHVASGPFIRSSYHADEMVSAHADGNLPA